VTGFFSTSMIVPMKRFTSRWVTASPMVRSTARPSLAISTKIRINRNARSAGCDTGIMPRTSNQLRPRNFQPQPPACHRQRNSRKNTAQMPTSILNSSSWVSTGGSANHTQRSRPTEMMASATIIQSMARTWWIRRGTSWPRICA
jgi:hypothetical protein